MGVLEGMIENLPKEEYSYDVISGVSVGAINAAIIAMYPKGEELQACYELEVMWKSHPAQDLWQFWPGLHIFGGLVKDAFIDSTPLREMAETTFQNRTFKRAFGWQSVDLNTGTVYTFDETIPSEYVPYAILASASIPGFFSPVQIGELSLVDGGTYDNLGLTEAVL